MRILNAGDGSWGQLCQVAPPLLEGGDVFVSGQQICRSDQRFEVRGGHQLGFLAAGNLLDRLPQLVR